MTEWNLVSFVLASEIRFKILVSLNNNVKSPTDLKKELDVPISRVSAVLKELTDNELVENLTPDRRKSKMFTTTEKGKAILQEIHKMTES